MKFAITISNNGANSDLVKELFKGFVEKKIKTFNDITARQSNNGFEDISEEQYLASLWMICSLMGILEQHDIAKQVNISYHLLKDWEDDEIFKTLVKCNYKDFLLYIVDLFA